MTGSTGTEGPGGGQGSEPRPLGARAAGRCFTILVVESNPMLRDYLQHLFRAGFPLVELTAVAGEREALACVAAHPPDLILVHVRAGEGRGFDLIRRLRLMVAGARVAILSDHVLPEYREEAFRCGAHHYLEKTAVRSEDILGLVRSAGGSSATA